MKREVCTNVFSDGLVMDTNPIMASDKTLSYCLNGTIITFNGNEYSLQNDMGNGRVETAELPAGYVPVGVAELGGIIYIASFNPLTGKCLMGSFPSPERNISSDEVSPNIASIDCSKFYTNDIVAVDNYSKVLSTPIQLIVLFDKELHSGDKFIVTCPFNTGVNNPSDIISAYGLSADKLDHNLSPKYLKFSVIAISSDGTITELNDSLVWQPISDTENDKYYYLYPKEIKNDENGKPDIDEYRDLVKSNYSIYTGKLPVKLGILAKVECISNFEIAYDANVIQDENADMWEFSYYLNWQYNNPNKEAKNLVNPSGVYTEIYDCTTGNENLIYKGGTNIEYPMYINKEIQLHTPDTKLYPNGIYCALNKYEEVNPETYPIGAVRPGKARSNDGKDFQYYLKNLGIKFAKTNKQRLLTFKVTPVMPFGQLSWLKQEFTINLAKLGSGETNLKEYYYYCNNSDIVLNWSLEAYPEKNKKINDVEFSFYEVTKDLVNNYGDRANEIGKDGNSQFSQPLKDLYRTLAVYIESNKSKDSYLGNFSFTIPISDENIKDALNKNKVYLVLINIDYSGSNRYYYRLLFPKGLFNNYYNKLNYAKIVEDSPNFRDFGKIELGKVIEKLLPKFNVDKLVLEDGTTPALFNRLIYNKNSKEIELLPSYTDAITEEKYIVLDEVKNARLLYSIDAIEYYDLLIHYKELDSKRVLNLDSEILNLKELTFKNNSLATIELNPIISEININSNNLKNLINLDKISIKTPIHVIYDLEKFLPIQLELTKIKTGLAYLGFNGGNNDVRLGLYDYFPAVDNYSSRINTSYTGNNTTFPIYNITEIKEIGIALKEQLDTVDILALICRPLKSKKKPGMLLWETEKNREVVWDKIGTGSFSVIYLIKNSYGEVASFVFSTNSRHDPYYGNLQNIGDIFAVFKDTSENIANLWDVFTLFNNYYKISPCSETLEQYQYGLIRTYNNYIIRIPFEINATLEKTIIINGVSFTAFNENSKLLNIPNLKFYNSKYTYKLNLETTVNVKSLLANLLNPVTKTLTKLPTEDLSLKVVDTEVSKSLVYDKDVNVISSIKLPKVSDPTLIVFPGISFNNNSFLNFIIKYNIYGEHYYETVYSGKYNIIASNFFNVRSIKCGDSIADGFKLELRNYDGLSYQICHNGVICTGPNVLTSLISISHSDHPDDEYILEHIPGRVAELSIQVTDDTLVLTEALKPSGIIVFQADEIDKKPLRVKLNNVYFLKA